MDWLHKLTILQLNRLIQEVHFDKYYQKVKDRSLQYTEEILQELNDYITVDMMQKIIIHELPKDDSPYKIPDINSKPKYTY